MAEYINIKGQNIEVVASDPANPTLGQIWYNSTSNTLKGEVCFYCCCLGNWWIIFLHQEALIMQVQELKLLV
jgi:hypothetical protein